jgi:hypothetical protein
MVSAACTCAAQRQQLRIEHLDAQSACHLTVSAPVFMHDAGMSFRFRRGRCAVVSSSGALSGSRCGGSIDAHDLVVRINQAPTRGYEDDVGVRRDLTLSNSHSVRRLKKASSSAAADFCASASSVVFFGDTWQLGDNESAVARLWNTRADCRAPALSALRYKALQLSPMVGAWLGSMNAQFAHVYRNATGQAPGGCVRIRGKGRRRGKSAQLCAPGSRPTSGWCVPCP